MTYTQCDLLKTASKNPRSVTRMKTAWIPTKFAKVGSYVSLKEKDGWVDGWLVAFSGNTISEDALPDPHADVKAHRIATGDAQQKKRGE